MGLEEIQAKIDAQGLKVRTLKTEKADKAAVDAAVKELLALKEEFKAAGGVIEDPKSSKKKKGAAPAAAPAAPAADDEAAKKKAKADEKEAKKAARKEGKAAAIAKKDGAAPAAPAAKPSKAAKPAAPAGAGLTVFPCGSSAIKAAAAIACLTVSDQSPPAPTAGAPMPAGTPAVVTSDGSVIAGAATVLSFCCEQSPVLAPASDLEAAQVQQWLSFCVSAKGADMAKGVDAGLLHSTHLAGNHLTAADLAVYEVVHPTMASTKGKGYTNLTRWFEYLQYCEGVCGVLPEVQIGTTFFVPQIVAGAGAKKSAPKEDKKAAKQAAPEAKKAEKPAAAEGELSDMQAKQLAKKKAKEDAKKASKEGKEGKEAAPAKEAKKATGDWNVSHLNIIVGTIVKAWEHPDSDKLWCEEIDCGEAQTRQIASGLRKYYPEQSGLQDRKVLVLANLKPKKLGGFPSNGMVLCASNSDKSKTIFVEVPEGVPNGERVSFAGFDGEPATPQQMDKKKVFEAVAPTLVVADDGTCTCNGSVAFTTTKGVCMAPGMGGAHIA